VGGSSKKVTVGYKYYLGEHMVLCHGPIDRLTRIRVDKRTLWEGSSSGGRISVSKLGLFGGESREGGISGSLDLEMGRDNQGQNDYLQARLGSLIPAFRGVVGVVLRQMYLGMNPYLKPWEFRAQRVYTRQNGLNQWYDEAAAIRGGAIGMEDYWEYQITSNSWSGSIPTTGWNNTGRAPFGHTPTYTPVHPTNTYWGPDTGLWIRSVVNCNGLQPVRISGNYENALRVYWDGTLVGEFNPSNDDITGGPRYDILIPRSMATEGDHQIALQALDDPQDYGNSDNTFLSCEVGTHVDMNPAHIIRECLTDPDWGMGYLDADIDDTSFKASADRLFDEKMGISLIWDREMPIEDFVNEIIRHIDATLYVDRTTGLFVLKLIRDDYVEEDLLILNEDNIQKVKDYNRNSPQEGVNTVVVKYWDAATGEDGSTLADDLALVQQQGRVVSTTVQYPGFTNPQVANRAAQRDLRALSSPLLSCTITANREAAQLNIGDTFKFYWPDYHEGYVIMRVNQISLGTARQNTVKITCSEDVYALPETSQVGSETPGWTDPNQPPEGPPARAFVETPYYELIQALGQSETDTLLTDRPEAGYIAAAAARPGDAINAVLSVDNGVGYEDVVVMDFSPSLELVNDITQTQKTFAYTEGQDLDLLVVGTHGYLNGEIVVLESIDTEALTVTIGRGALDTTPAVGGHPAGSVLMFWDVYLEGDNVEYAFSETINGKIRPTTGAGTLALEDTATDTVTMNSRAVRPYPPGNLEIDGVSYPELVASNEVVATWVHRDRIQQTAGEILDHLAGSVGPEPGTTYRAQLFTEGGVLHDETSGITDTNFVFNLAGLPTEVAHVKIYSERDGYLSWQPAQSVFEFTLATLFMVYPLTYNEASAEGSMQFASYGGAGLITPNGFMGDGYEGLLKATDIPVWANMSTSRISISASVRVFEEHVRNTSRETILFHGENTSGTIPNAKLALTKLPDPNNSEVSYVSLETYDAVREDYPVFKPSWKFHGQFPEQERNGYGAKPQGVYFVDANNLLISAHYDNQESVVFRVDPSDMSVTGTFSFGTTTHRHVASFATNSAGDLWCVDYDTGHTLKVDLAASLSSGSAVILADWDTSVLNIVSGISFITLSGTEYVLIGEYSTGGSPYLYVIPVTEMVDASVFDIANRYKRFAVGITIQGVDVHNDELWLMRNSASYDANGTGWLERYDSAEALLTSSADGATLTPDFKTVAPSGYPEDISFHPVTGEVWTSTEGWRDTGGGGDGWHSIWSSTADGMPAENVVEMIFDGVDTITVKLNNYLFDNFNHTPTASPDCFTVMGPPDTDPGFQNGYCFGYVKNLRIQNKAMTETEYNDTVSGSYELRTLTEYDVTILNGAAELGDTTNWVNEQGSIALRTGNPDAPEGGAYFYGGANALTISRNRTELLTNSSVTSAELDDPTKDVWLLNGWYQSSWSSSDAGTVGMRALDASQTQLLEARQEADEAPYSSSDPWYWYRRGFSMGLPVGSRYADMVYRAERTAGTNNDPYTDSIRAKILVRDERVDQLADKVVRLLNFEGTDGSTTMTDETGATWTAESGAALSSTRSKFGTTSLALNGTSDYISAASSVDFELGDGDFTIECFVYATATGASRVLLSLRDASNDWNFYWRYTNRIAGYNTADGTYAEGGTNLVANTWYHFAFVRENNRIRLYVDGVLEATSSTITTSVGQASATLGTNQSLSQFWQGNIADFRITKGVARYKGRFAPPTRKFVL